MEKDEILDIKEVKDICDEIADIYRAKMDKEGYDKRGELYNFKWTTKWNNDLFEVWFELPDYFTYAEEGRKPTKNNGPGNVRHAIENWIRIKHIIPRPINGKIPSTQQMIYAITHKIHKKGFEGKHLLEKSQEDSRWDDLVDKLEDVILDLIEKEIEPDIEQL